MMKPLKVMSVWLFLQNASLRNFVPKAKDLKEFAKWLSAVIEKLWYFKSLIKRDIKTQKNSERLLLKLKGKMSRRGEREPTILCVPRPGFLRGMFASTDPPSVRGSCCDLGQDRLLIIFSPPHDVSISLICSPTLAQYENSFYLVFLGNWLVHTYLFVSVVQPVNSNF